MNSLALSGMRNYEVNIFAPFKSLHTNLDYLFLLPRNGISSSNVYTTGTTISVNIVDVINPPITACPIGERNSLPSPIPSATRSFRQHHVSSDQSTTF